MSFVVVRQNTELTLAKETLTSFADTTTENDDGHVALKRAAENSEGWRHKERMSKT